MSIETRNIKTRDKKYTNLKRGTKKENCELRSDEPVKNLST